LRLIPVPICVALAFIFQALGQPAPAHKGITVVGLLALYSAQHAIASPVSLLVCLGSLRQQFQTSDNRFCGSCRWACGTQRALELPWIEHRRIGLSEWKQAWVYVSEYDYDIVERSFYLEPNSEPRKELSSKFMSTEIREFRPTSARRGARVDRRS
jgi:hypothetical protein